MLFAIGVHPGGWGVAKPRFWDAKPRFWDEGRGVAGDRRGVSEGSRKISIAYFAQKYFAKWFLYRK